MALPRFWHLVCALENKDIATQFHQQWWTPVKCSGTNSPLCSSHCLSSIDRIGWHGAWEASTRWQEHSPFWSYQELNKQLKKILTILQLALASLYHWYRHSRALNFPVGFPPTVRSDVEWDAWTFLKSAPPTHQEETNLTGNKAHPLWDPARCPCSRKESVLTQKQT